MKGIRVILLLPVLMLVLSGCIYTHTREPLTLNMHATPAAGSEKQGTLQLISVPWSFNDVKLVAWGTAAIGDVARKAGMQEVYYADIEILSVLRIWNQYTVHVYGR